MARLTTPEIDNFVSGGTLTEAGQNFISEATRRLNLLDVTDPEGPAIVTQETFDELAARVETIEASAKYFPKIVIYEGGSIDPREDGYELFHIFIEVNVTLPETGANGSYIVEYGNTIFDYAHRLATIDLPVVSVSLNAVYSDSFWISSTDISNNGDGTIVALDTLIEDSVINSVRWIVHKYKAEIE